MLSLRSVNTQEPNPAKKTTKRIRNKAIATAGDLKNANSKILNPNKPKPLQASTNTIHSQQRANHSLNKKTNDDDLCKKPTLKNEPTKPSLKDTKVNSDENDVSEFAKHAYSPLNDIHLLDEELYQRVLKLELADDGLPDYKCTEPFDF